MIQPAEMKKTRPLKLHDGVVSTTTDVWNMLVASQAGDLDRVKELAQRCPALLTCQYDYTSPLHLAVREGHLELVRYLVTQAGIDPNCRTHPHWGQQEMVALLLERGADVNKAGAPWATPLAWARKKEHAEIAALLQQHGASD